MKKFELIEHTADIGLRVFGETAERLFVNAGVGLFSMLTDERLETQMTKMIRVEAQRFDELLVCWLNELIGLFYAGRFLPAELEVSIKSCKGVKSLRAVTGGGRFDPYRDKVKLEIKAATYHNLRFERHELGFYAEVIFDI